MSSTTGPLAGGRDAERGRDRAVDPVGAAVGEHARRVVAAPARSVSTSRTGIEEATTSVAPRRQRARRARRATRGSRELRRAEHPSRSPARRAGRRAPGREPRLARGRRRRPRAPRASRAGSAAIDVATRRGRVLPRALGVERDLDAPSSPASQVRSGLEVGRSPDAQHELGRVGRGEARRRAAARRSARRRPGRGGRPRAGRRAADSRRRPRTRSRGARAAGRRARRARRRAPAGVARCAASVERGARRARARGTRDPRPPVRAARVVGAAARRATSGSRSGKFRWTGPGRPSSAVQNARQASVRIQRSRSGVGLVRADLEEPLRGVAVELDLVDRLARRRPRAAPAGDRR